MGTQVRRDFTENLEAVARGVRRLEEIRDPTLRTAVAAALRLRETSGHLDPAARLRMRRQVLAALAPSGPTFLDRTMAVFGILAVPTPALLRILAGGLVGVSLLASATVASAGSLPDDALYPLKLAGEQLRLAIASTPEDRAAVEISIAVHRLEEAERLAEAGRDDATIGVASAYGVSVANAAAELASVETLQPKLANLVVQLNAQLLRQQGRVESTAKRLAEDPRTAGAAIVLATVGAGSEGDPSPSAVRIADDAAAAATRLATVAATRAAPAAPASRQAVAPADTVGPGVAAASLPVSATQAPRSEGSEAGSGGAGTHGSNGPNPLTRPSVATSAPTLTPAAAPPDGDPGDEDPNDARAAAPASVATLRPLATAHPPGPRTTAAPLDLEAAREAARRAEHAAEDAREAAHRAKENSRRTASPSPARR